MSPRSYRATLECGSLFQPDCLLNMELFKSQNSAFLENGKTYEETHAGGFSIL